MEKDIKSFQAFLKRQNLSKSTIGTYSNLVSYFYEQGYTFNFENCCKWKEEQQRVCKPGTVNVKIHAMNRYCEFMRVRFRLKPVKMQVPQYADNLLTMGMYQRLLNCLWNDGEIKWWVSIKVLACTGVRISEFLQIRLDDIRTGYVDVCGKGNKYRRVWFSASLRSEILSAYKVNGVLLSCSDGVIRKRLHVFAKRYSLPKEPLHPHAFRSLFARSVYEKSKDIKFLQDLLGHADIKTTMRYLRKSSKGISRRVSSIVKW